jgi:hypothetical protein
MTCDLSVIIMFGDKDGLQLILSAETDIGLTQNPSFPVRTQP